MGDDNLTCPQHTGQVERTNGLDTKMNLLITLIVLQLGATVSFGGMVNSRIGEQLTIISKLQVDVAVVSAKARGLEESIYELKRRTDALEKK